MKFIKKLKEKGYAFRNVKDKFIFYQQKLYSDKQDLVGILYDLKLKLLSELHMFMSPRVYYEEDNQVFGVDKSESSINKVDLISWSIVNSYAYPSDSHPILFLNNHEVVLKSRTAYLRYNFINNSTIWEIKSPYSLLRQSVRNTFLVFTDLNNHSKIINVNLKKGEKLWEHDFSQKEAFQDFFNSRADFELYSKLENTSIRTFDFFEDKIIIQFQNGAILLAIDIESGKCLWTYNQVKWNPTYSDYSHFKIDIKGLCYLLGDKLDYHLKTIDINTGKLVWESKINWLKQSQLTTTSYFSDFSMNEKYIFITNVSRAIILVIDKATGVLVEEMPVFKKQKEIYGVVDTPQIMGNKLLQLVVGELFVYDISEYV